MKTLVTGASGFIGSAVVRRLLARGREVRCFVEPGARRDNLAGLDVEIVEGDVNDRPRVDAALAGCDVLYHLAAIYAFWLPDNSKMYEVNVEGTKNVLWAAYKAGLKKVVYTSSIAALGRTGDETPADETTPFGKRDWDEGNHYIRSKWLSQRDALRFAREGLPLVVVNPAFPFGARDIAPTPTGNFVLGVLRREIPGWPRGGGMCVIDVDDCAEGHVLAEDKGRLGECYILGDHNVGYGEFFATVARVGGVPAPRFAMPRPLVRGYAWALEHVDLARKKAPRATYKSVDYGSRALYYDCTKARRELGLPSTPLEVTVEKAVRWFRDHHYC